MKRATWAGVIPTGESEDRSGGTERPNLIAAEKIAQSEAPADRPVTEDHRVRVARERRARMRAHLLEAVLHVCSAETARSPAVIDDVVRQAAVSRGSFYKYFDSLDEAVAELGLQLADEMTASILSVYDVLEDPVLRTATGFQMFLIRAMMEPNWGSFIAQIGLLRGEHLFTSKIRDDISLGIETGDYVVPDIETASDLLMGAKIEAIRRLIDRGGSVDYIHSMTSLVLRGFGVTASKADKSVIKAFHRLTTEAVGKIPWWTQITGNNAAAARQGSAL